MTEKPISVTESSDSVTSDSVTASRAQESLRLLSRLSRVTDNAVTVTDGRDSDSHSPPVRDRHGHPAIVAGLQVAPARICGTSENLSRSAS